MTDSAAVPVARAGGRDALARALDRYRTAPLVDRVFTRARARLASLLELEACVPERGRIVELGCGRGLFSNLLVESSSDRHVLGIDHDPRRIAIAKLTERPRLSFEQGDIREVELPAADCVAIVDVLYLLDESDQRRVLARAAEALRSGGQLVVYAQERRADPRFWLGYAQELVATGVGLTRGHALRYVTRRQMRAHLEAQGLEVRVTPLRGRLYTDAIYVGTKSA